MTYTHFWVTGCNSQNWFWTEGHTHTQTPGKTLCARKGFLSGEIITWINFPNVTWVDKMTDFQYTPNSFHFGSMKCNVPLFPNLLWFCLCLIYPVNKIIINIWFFSSRTKEGSSLRHEWMVLHRKCCTKAAAALECTIPSVEDELLLSPNKRP